MERDTAFMEKRPGSGRWYIRYKDPSTGKWRRKSLGTRKKLEANLKFSDALKGLQANSMLNNPTLKQAVAIWLAENAEREISFKHLSAIRLGAKELCGFFGTQELADISRTRMRSLLATHQHRQGNGGRNKLSIYRMFFRWAVAERIIQSDPTHDLGRLIKTAAPPKRTPRISDQDLVDLLSDLESDRIAKVLVPIVSFLSFTGVRSIDAIRLRWENVNLEKELIHIIPGTGKGAARLLPCPKDALPARSPNSDRVFNLTKSQLVGYWRRFKSKPRNARWKGTSLHSLRVRVNSKLVEAGHEALARAMLGHADVDMTAHYTRVFGAEGLSALSSLTPQA
jgi:integrase/recombinase XerD